MAGISLLTDQAFYATLILQEANGVSTMYEDRIVPVEFQVLPEYQTPSEYSPINREVKLAFDEDKTEPPVQETPQ